MVKRIILIGSVSAIAAVALGITLTIVLTPPVFANAVFGPQFRAGGPWHMGQGPAMWSTWHSGNWNMIGGNQSKTNWTGSVSVQSIKSDIIDTIKTKVKENITDVASTSEKALGGGSRIGSVMLSPVNGYLVYQVYGIDSSDNVHRLIIDAGSGKVLENTNISTASGLGH